MHLKLVVVVAVACLAVTLVEGSPTLRQVFEQFRRDNKGLPTTQDLKEFYLEAVSDCESEHSGEIDENEMKLGIDEFLKENEGTAEEVEGKLETAVKEGKMPSEDDLAKLKELRENVEKTIEGIPAQYQCSVGRVVKKVEELLEGIGKKCNRLTSNSDKRGACEDSFLEDLKDDWGCFRKSVGMAKKSMLKDIKAEHKHLAQNILDVADMMAKVKAVEHAAEMYKKRCGNDKKEKVSRSFASLFRRQDGSSEEEENTLQDEIEKCPGIENFDMGDFGKNVKRIVEGFKKGFKALKTAVGEKLKSGDEPSEAEWDLAVKLSEAIGSAGEKLGETERCVYEHIIEMMKKLLSENIPDVCDIDIDEEDLKKACEDHTAVKERVKACAEVVVDFGSDRKERGGKKEDQEGEALFRGLAHMLVFDEFVETAGAAYKKMKEVCAEEREQKLRELLTW